LVVTKPKVTKTIGEITITATNHGEKNLFSLPAQTALIEFAATATRTAVIMYNHVTNLFTI